MESPLGLTGIVRHKHLDALDYSDNGALIVGASNLTGRCWTGCLAYYAPFATPGVHGGPRLVTQLDSGVADVKWIKGSSKFVTGCDSGSVSLWEVTDEGEGLGCVAPPLVVHGNGVSCLSVSADRTQLLSASFDRSIRLWNADEFTPTTSYTGHCDGVMSAEFHPCLKDVFVSCSQDGVMLVWDTRKPKPAARIETQFLRGSLATSVAWVPGSDHLVAIATAGGEVLVQDSRRGVGVPARAAVHARAVRRMAFAPHRRELVASASEDATVGVTRFNICAGKDSEGMESKGSCLLLDRTHTDFVQGVAWHPLTHHLTSCSWDGQLITRAVPAEGGVAGAGSGAGLVNGHASGDVEPAGAVVNGVVIDEAMA